MAVLSIQSHVVYGYAGNTAAVFPLQRLGREVWAINTVEFSNHTGYGSWRGKILGAELAGELVKGLEERGVLNQCQAVLSGYLGDREVGLAVINAVKKVRKESLNSLYCCDPVMGDIGRGFYVKPDIPDMFKKELTPLADIITPNQFELETLTGISIVNIEDALNAINILHEMGPSIVLLTSFKEKERELSMIASDKTQVYKITTPELPLGDGVAGTGDMTAAVFLSRYLETKNLTKALEMCTASVFSILEASYKAFSQTEQTRMELKIIEAQEYFTSPVHCFKPERIK
jgi:pyridoxine kinase